MGRKVKGSEVAKFALSSIDVDRHLNEVRSRVANAYLIGLAALALPGVAASLYRAVDVGWKPIMALHAGLALSVFAMTLLRRKLAYRFRAAYLVGLLVILGVAGLLSFGLLSSGPLFLFSASIVAFLLFGARAGAAASAGCILLGTATYLALAFGILDYAFDHKAYATALSSWVSAGVGLALMMSAIGFGVASFNRQLIDALRRVEQERADLASSNAALETEISARRDAEARLGEAQKMQAVGQLAGGIAHDFNNILGVLLGNLDLAAQLAKSDDPQMALLERAIKAAERGATLTHRLLGFSRRQTLISGVTDVAALIAGLADLVQSALGDSVSLRISHATDLWPSFVDANQLESAILNLAINARDAMPGGGELIIETNNVSLHDTQAAALADAQTGDYVMISVGDTGTGMSQDVLERAVEPFYTTKGVGKGTGLGLSMVYGFVKQSGGYMKIDTEVGRGTTVRICLPRAM